VALLIKADNILISSHMLKLLICYGVDLWPFNKQKWD